MKIVTIFADELFAFLYTNESENEYDRLMNLWTDVSYLRSYAEMNEVVAIDEFIKDILRCTEQIQDTLESISQNSNPYGLYFEPLQASEARNRSLTLQKGKIKRNILRLYAIKLDERCFVITGGAIKMSQKMQEHPDTNNELLKLQNAKIYLSQNGVIDDGSFFELLSEAHD